MNHFVKTFTAGCAISLACAAAAAEAREPPVTLNKDKELISIVTYTDLNIGSVAGAKTLERRLHRAAERVCQKPIGRVSVSESMRYRTCQKQAFESAIAMIYSEYPDTAARLAQAAEAGGLLSLAPSQSLP